MVNKRNIRHTYGNSDLVHEVQRCRAYCLRRQVECQADKRNLPPRQSAGAPPRAASFGLDLNGEALAKEESPVFGLLVNDIECFGL